MTGLGLFFTGLGIKISLAVAGFCGGLVSLAFLEGLTRKQAVLAVLVGCFTAIYGTPAIMLWFNVNPQLENATAFLAGLTAMNIIPLVKKAAAARFQAQTATPEKDAA